MEIGKKRGHGNCSFANGDTFERDFVSNIKHNKGIFIDPSKELLYQGDFMNEKRDGKGLYEFKNDMVGGEGSTISVKRKL